jgi:hypothetical protein
MNYRSLVVSSKSVGAPANLISYTDPAVTGAVISERPGRRDRDGKTLTRAATRAVSVMLLIVPPYPSPAEKASLIRPRTDVPGRPPVYARAAVYRADLNTRCYYSRR